MLKNVLSMTAICPLFIGDYKKGSRKPWLWFQCVRRAAGKGCLREYDPAWWPSWPSRVETFWPHSSGTVCLYKKERGGKKSFTCWKMRLFFWGFCSKLGENTETFHLHSPAALLDTPWLFSPAPHSATSLFQWCSQNPPLWPCLLPDHQKINQKSANNVLSIKIHKRQIRSKVNMLKWITVESKHRPQRSGSNFSFQLID